MNEEKMSNKIDIVHVIIHIGILINAKNIVCPKGKDFDKTSINIQFERELLNQQSNK